MNKLLGVCKFLLLIYIFTKTISAETSLSEIQTPIEVEGSVNNPGIHSVSSRGLLNALHEAGGIASETCLKWGAIVSGKNKAKTAYKKYKFDINDIISRNAKDIWVPPGWKITIPNIHFYCGPHEVLNGELQLYIEARNKNIKSEYDLSLMDFYVSDGKD